MSSVFFAGCTIPAEILFRNYSNRKVMLDVSLADRKFFDRLPNKVNFYDTSASKHQFSGGWRASTFVTWVDSITFYLEVPPFTVVDVADISNGLTLGTKQPDVMLIMTTDHRADTLITGSYVSVAKKFKSTGYGLFKSPVYYYDNR